MIAAASRRTGRSTRLSAWPIAVSETFTEVPVATA
jgi:hypothetical protein